MKNRLKILLVEKNESVGQLLCEFMQMYDFQADMFIDPEEAGEAYATGNYAICIINVETSSHEEDFALVKKIKSINPDVILIFLGTNPTIEIISQAYALEADDFIRKPFILEELQLRIMAIIRRSRGLDILDTPIYNIGKYVFDAKKQMLSINGVDGKVTTKECDLLKYLCENMNSLVLREDVLRIVWKNNSYYNARSMDVYITKLRRLLKDDNRVGIVNVHGKGYKLLVI
ncbi:MAG: response regulator transcription factor [Tannerellaceae bacterium]|nr:response regulator transcription factor [Tannerellaceae bacterium]